jgi:hypothetical protein
VSRRGPLVRDSAALCSAGVGRDLDLVRRRPQHCACLGRPSSSCARATKAGLAPTGRADVLPSIRLFWVGHRRPRVNSRVASIYDGKVIKGTSLRIAATGDSEAHEGSE